MLEKFIQLTHVYNLYPCCQSDDERRMGNTECKEIFPQEKEIRFILLTIVN